MLCLVYAELGVPVEEHRLSWWHNRTHARMQLCEWLECEGAFAEAEPLYNLITSSARTASHALALMQAGMDPVMQRATYLNNHALCLKRQGRFAQALPLYREAAQFSSARNVRENLAKCEQLVGRPTVPSRGANYIADGDHAMSNEASGAERERIKELGNDAFKRSRFDEACRLYTAALAADDAAPAPERATSVERAKILCNRAAASLGHDDYDSAIDDARAATSLDPKNCKAWFRLGSALLEGEGPKPALEALRTALELKPGDKAVLKKIRRAESKDEADDGPEELPIGAINVAKMRFADTPLGKLDRLVGAQGLGGVGEGWLRGLYDAAVLWHNGLRDAQTFRSVGVDVRAELLDGLPIGSMQALSDTGAHMRTFDASAADVVRRLSDAIWQCDEKDIACPLHAWIEGRLYNPTQMFHSLNGLGAVLRAHDAVITFHSHLPFTPSPHTPSVHTFSSHTFCSHLLFTPSVRRSSTCRSRIDLARE